MKATMRAACTPRYGPPDVVQLVDVPRPSPGPREVLIRVIASPITEGDRRIRAADYPSFTCILGRLAMGLTSPRKPVGGSNFAGRVVEVGAEVTQYKVGDDVFGGCMAGGHAELLLVPEQADMAIMPRGVDHATACGVSYGAGTALNFLKDLAKLQPGERLLVLGGSGGVGRFAIQIGKHMGAEVTAVCSSRHEALCRELGADHTIDYSTCDISSAGEFDVVFDLADATSFGRCRRLLSPAGRYATVYISLGVLASMAWTSLVGGRRALFTVAMPSRDDHAALADLLERRAITPRVAHRFPLASIVEAYRAQETTKDAGTVVVEVSSVDL